MFGWAIARTEKAARADELEDEEATRADELEVHALQRAENLACRTRLLISWKHLGENGGCVAILLPQQCGSVRSRGWPPVHIHGQTLAHSDVPVEQACYASIKCSRVVKKKRSTINTSPRTSHCQRRHLVRRFLPAELAETRDGARQTVRRRIKLRVLEPLLMMRQQQSAARGVSAR